MDLKVLTAHVPRQLAERVDVLAARLERSRDWIMKQALADVDAGHVIDQQAVEAWAASLGTGCTLPLPR
jgi:predicted transcriptional regulator